MKRLLLALFVAGPALHAFGQAIPKTMLRLPDTGQTADFTPAPGEDSDYSIHPPYFVLNGDGTATDTVTGLMWQRADGGEMSVENATVYCDTLTLGGFSDWRLPNAHESFSILNHGHANPALDPNAFAVSAAEYWWTSTRQANDANRVWVTNAGGGIGNHPKSETVSAGGSKKFHVRAVRDRQAPPTVPGHFSNNGDGTVGDLLTGLIWQPIPLSDSLNWEQALFYAENLSLGGHDDWRLPNIRELQSLNDENRINPSVDPGFFSAIGVGQYWSSTSLPNQPARAWYWDTRFGITTYALKTQRLRLVCVRGPVDATVSVGETGADKAGCVAFPNPFTDHISVRPPVAAARIEILNLLGARVYSGTDLEGADLSHLPAGVYFLNIYGRRRTTLRVIKQEG